MPAWSTVVDAAVVDDHDGATESLAQSVGSFDVVAHILVAAFGAGERAVQGIDDDNRRGMVELGFDVRDQLLDLPDEIETSEYELELVWIDWAANFFLSERLDAGGDGEFALATDVESEPL